MVKPPDVETADFQEMRAAPGSASRTCTSCPREIAVDVKKNGQGAGNLPGDRPPSELLFQLVIFAGAAVFVVVLGGPDVVVVNC